MIGSMTPDERREPSIINGSRRQRIARGSGASVSDVNRLLKQYAQLKKMMKGLKQMEGRMGKMKGAAVPAQMTSTADQKRSKSVAVHIRLRRTGRSKKPSYRVVVADSRAARDGRFIEVIGHYSPLTTPATLEIKLDKAAEWIKKGAQPSNTVRTLLLRAGARARKRPRPDAMTVAAAPLVAVGEVLKPHGLTGEVKVRSLSDRTEDRFRRLRECILWEPRTNRTGGVPHRHLPIGGRDGAAQDRGHRFPRGGSSAEWPAARHRSGRGPAPA